MFQRNGKPYPVSNGDNILVEIVHQGIKVATTMEYGGPDPTSANIAKVSFTIYKSGEYLISILIGGRHIKGSPFKKNFEAGKFFVACVAIPVNCVLTSEAYL